VLDEKAFFPCFWHEEIEDAESRCCDGGKEEESRVETKMMNNRTGDRLTKRSADSDRRTDRSKGDIEST
jgi:hypothetical protein